MINLYISTQLDSKKPKEQEVLQNLMFRILIAGSKNKAPKFPQIK